MMQLPIKMPRLPAYRESVDRAASGENLRVVASTTSDPVVLLGLSFFARAGDPVRKEIGEAAVRARGEYAPVIALLSVIMDRIDDESVGEFLQRDPENGLGHYLRGTLLHVANRETEALDAFRKAASCAEVRLYDSLIGEALFAALEALHLEGLDRLCALCWTISRWSNFSSAGIQPIYGAISELARDAGTTTRSEFAEMLLGLAGHLFATNFTNRWFALRAVEAAFLLKAELAAPENASKMNGYAAAVYGLTRNLLFWPALEDPGKPKPFEVARLLPSSIHRALAAAEPSLMNAGVLGDTNLHPPESERAAFEAAKARATETAKKLVDGALADPDAILRAYLKGLPEKDRGPGPPWVSFSTPVGKLMEKRPELFRTAAEFQAAMSAVWQAGQSDPLYRNMGRMLEIAWAIQSYAQQHDGVFPGSITVLFENGFLKPPLEAKSLLTGRPYVYVAAGEKNPAKMNDRAQFVLLYDDEPHAYGSYDCVFASCISGQIRVADLEQQLRRRF